MLESNTHIAAFVLALLSAETRRIKAIRTHKIYAKALIAVGEETMESSVKTKRVSIIAMTANAFPEDVQKCLSAGMNGHIGKPISVEAIAKQLFKL